MPSSLKQTNNQWQTAETHQTMHVTQAVTEHKLPYLKEEIHSRPQIYFWLPNSNTPETNVQLIIHNGIILFASINKQEIRHAYFNCTCMDLVDPKEEVGHNGCMYPTLQQEPCLYSRLADRIKSKI